jgi:hypothetical protein
MRTHRLADATELGDVGEVADVLVVLEDFLLHAGVFIVDELAAYPVVRPDDPQSWVLWIAGLLGEHAATLRALTPATEATTALPAHQPIGEPR